MSVYPTTIVDCRQSALDNARATRRLGAVTNQCVAQVVFELPQPGLVIAPLVQALAENRLPHLFGACRAYAALGAMKLETGRLERQFTIGEDAPHAGLQIIHDILVEYPQHPARQRRIPMFHELEGGAVVAGDVINAVEIG